MDSINALLNHIFDSEARVFLIVGALLIGVSELGHRFGLRLHRSQDEPRIKQIEAVQAAVLALMGLLLAFTFSMAVQRYDQRNRLVVDEANAIGTAFLRASFLPDAARLEARDFLRHYVTVRLEREQAAASSAGLVAHEARLAQVQRQLWQQAVVVTRENPNSMITSYATALNAVFDLDSDRLAMSRNHVPGAVWLLLLVLASTGCWFTGYRVGAMGRRSMVSLLSLPLLITVVITLVSDLDRSHIGLIGVNQQPMVDLQESVQPDQR